MISWQRSVYLLGLVLLEATLASLVLTVLGIPAWRVLIAVVLAGALADRLAQRWLRSAWHRPTLFGVGLLASLWAVKVHFGGGVAPWFGWDAAWVNLVTGRGQSAIAYTLLFVALYAFWRGTLLALHESASLQRLFVRSLAGVLVIIGIGGLVGITPAEHVARATAQVLSFFCIGLLTIALAGTGEDDPQLRRMDWRGFATLVGAVALVLLLGFLTALVFGDQAAAAARTVWQIVVFGILLVLSPVLLALGALVAWIVRLLPVDRTAQLLQQQQHQQLQLPPAQQASGGPAWLALPVQVLCVVVPLLVLLALFLFWKRHPAAQPRADEQRESLFSARGVLQDLRDLLAGMRLPGRDGGLRAALAQLRGTDPATRVRRSYVRMLLAAEAREQPRGAAQTPHEYEAPAAQALASTGAIARLTRLYERARYGAAVAPADADAAEHAWREIDGKQ